MVPEQDALVIGSRFDTDVSKAACRLAFYGRLVTLLRAEDPRELARLRIFKTKTRAGSIDRVAPDGFSAVCKGMFKKDTDISLFAGMKVRGCSGIPSLGRGVHVVIVEQPISAHVCSVVRLALGKPPPVLQT